MVEREALDAVFRSLADPVRRDMVAALHDGPKSVSELAAPHDMSLAGAAKHVNVLVEARLVRKQRVGRRQVCRLDPGPMIALREWLDTYARFWTERLDALDAALKEYENGQH